MIRVHTRHRRCTGLPLYGEGSAYTDALEKYNRETHSDALREMQLAPAETEQPVSIEMPARTGSHLGWTFPMMIALGFAITVIGVIS